MKAIGGSRRVALISGIKVNRVTFLAYAAIGVAVSIASLFASARSGIADVSLGAGMNLNIMTAVVLGGFPLEGGANARYSGPIIGSLMVTILNNGLAGLGYANAIGFGIQGILLITVVAMTYDKNLGKLIS